MHTGHSATGWAAFALWLPALAAAALAGCDQHAASQTPSPGTVAAPAMDSPEDTAASESNRSQASTNENEAPSASEGTAVSQPAADERAAAAPPNNANNDGPPRPAGKRPKADRSAASGGVEKITFDDLILGMQADMVYRPWMLESETNGGRAKELDGKKVRLAGVMHGGVQGQTRLKEFVLLRNIECKFGPGGQADHLAKVSLKEGKTTKYAGLGTVIVEGTLRIEPEIGEDGNTWSLYRIEGAEVK